MYSILYDPLPLMFCRTMEEKERRVPSRLTGCTVAMVLSSPLVGVPGTIKMKNKKNK